MEKPKVSFSTDRLYVRSVEEADKEDYMSLRVAVSPIALAYEESPGFRDIVWEKELNNQDDIYLSVFLKSTHALVASASFQDYKTDIIEFGFDVVEGQRNQGIATELVREMLNYSKKTFPGKTVMIRTGRSNVACRRVAEKCGGVLSENGPTLAATAITQLIERFGNEPTENEELIQMRKKGAEFIEANKYGVCIYLFK